LILSINDAVGLFGGPVRRIPNSSENSEFYGRSVGQAGDRDFANSIVNCNSNLGHGEMASSLAAQTLHPVLPAEVQAGDWRRAVNICSHNLDAIQISGRAVISWIQCSSSANVSALKGGSMPRA
jgi:hypothetical protein